jgi:TonB-dependent starch-binding outer membrane protein SusC
MLMSWLNSPMLRRCSLAAVLLLGAMPTLGAQAVGTIRGRVTDAGTQRPISDVQVTVTGRTNGAVTNASGDYVITAVPAGTYELAARRLGYARTTRSVTVAAGSEARADFQLRISSSTLDAVVITGTAGAAEKRSLGNSITQLDVADISQKTNVVNVQEVLQSKTPGLTMLPNSGTPGAAAEFRIRGAGSLVGYKPVVYIDGVRYNIESLGNFNPTGTIGGTGGQAQSTQVTSALGLISPQDIESIEVIKGPAAATLYGAEAANGVIQIITKKGTRGQQRTSFNVRAETGINRLAVPIPANYTLCAVNATLPGCVGQPGTTLLVQNPLKDDPNALRTGQLRKYNASVRGGADQYSYFVSMNHDENQGVQLNSYDNRNGGRANFSFSPASNSDVQINFGFSQEHLRLPLADEAAAGLSFGAARGRPGCSTSADSICYTIGYPSVAYRYNNQTRTQRITLGSTLNYSPVSWFRNRFTVGLDNTGSTAEILSLPGESSDEPTGAFNQQVPRSTIYTIDYAGNAEHAFSSALISTTSVGAQVVSNRSESIFGQGIGLGAPTVTVLGSATTRTSTNTYSEQNSVGYYAQEQLAWNNRLFLIGAVRFDNNSAFGANFYRIAYPKLSASYVVSEEPSMRDRLLSLGVNSLKLRTAWGKAGRAPNPYSATQTYGVSTTTLGTTSVSALRTSAFGNPNLKPETGQELEIGFDAGALSDRVGVEFTFYNKTTNDLLVAVPVAPSLGFNSSPQTNFGSIRNRGVEMSFSTTPVTRTNFAWDSRITFSANRNTLLSVPDTNTAKAISGQAYTPGAQENHVGYPLGGYWIAHPLRDANGGYVLTAARAIAIDSVCTTVGGRVTCPQNKQYVGSPVPLREIGFSNTITLFKNFSIYGLLDYKGGHYLFNGRMRNQCMSGNNCLFVNTPGRDSIDIKAWRQSTNYEPYVEKADFVKLRDLSFTLQVPQRYLRFTGGSDASIVLAGHDLKVWTDYTGSDPETNSYGGRLFARADVYTFPMTQRWSLALNLSF